MLSKVAQSLTYTGVRQEKASGKASTNCTKNEHADVSWLAFPWLALTLLLDLTSEMSQLAIGPACDVCDVKPKKSEKLIFSFDYDSV
jgi:hypothetical protein